MIRSDCIHLGECGGEMYYCSHSSRSEDITTCAGCDLYKPVMTPVDVILFKVDDLMDENTRLRELARDAIRAISCDRCWHERQGHCTPTHCVWDERAGSLGIEVDG